MEIIYELDRVDLSTYDVYVSASEGLLSRPRLKKPNTMSWQEYHGEVVDLSKRTYEPREISLECFIKAESQSDFVTKCNTFISLFDNTGTRRLTVFVDNEITPKPLVYEVYLSDSVDVKKKWRDGAMAGTFNLRLIEPEPIKRVIKYTRTGEADKTASITVTSSKLLNVYWGDGSHTYDVSGNAQTITHDFTANGTFYIVVTGNIDEIASLTTTGEIVWNKL